MSEQGHLRMQDLERFAGQAFGSGYRPVSTERLYGGAQKVIYKVDFANGFVCLLYVWDLSMNYFQPDIEEADNPALIAYGADRFDENHAFLTRHGIPTPALYAMNRERDRYSFDYALVEYIDGPKLETMITDESNRGSELMTRFADLLKRMHGMKRAAYGPPERSGQADGSEDPREEQVPCHRNQLFNAIKQLDFAARHVGEVAACQERFLRKLHELERDIAPRREYGFIHGELGPDHVLVKNDADLYLIDIEGASFYDVEHEHSFLEIRFGGHYDRLRDGTLDPRRLAFYRLHQYISLTAGGLKLLQRGFHDAALARQIFDNNLRSALRFIG